MIYLISILFGSFALAVFIYGLSRDAKNEIWNSLTSSYGEGSGCLTMDGYRIQMVFFKLADDVKYDYFNSMKIGSREDGIEIRPTINHCFLKPIFLPYSELEKVGKKRLFLLNRTIYKVGSTDILIGV